MNDTMANSDPPPGSDPEPDQAVAAFRSYVSIAAQDP